MLGIELGSSGRMATAHTEPCLQLPLWILLQDTDPTHIGSSPPKALPPNAVILNLTDIPPVAVCSWNASI